MSRRALALLLSLLAPTVSLAGCFNSGGGDGDDDLDQTNMTGNQGAPNATLPDDRGEAIAFQETNKTEEGLGGVEHKHDYWKGETRAVVFSDTVFFSFIPVYPDGPGSNPRSVAYIKLPQPNLVYEGATSVEVLVESVDVEGVAHPMAPALTLTYRTASGDGFQDGPALAIGSPAILPVSAKETDMPHSVSSLWAFRIATDRPEWFSTAKVTITAVKGSEVVDWPGHPEFYTDSSQRVVVDKDFKVHRAGLDELMLYGAASTWVAPDKLISYGTGRLDVFINITRAVASNGAEPKGFFLEYHNATILDAENRFNERLDDEEKGREFTHKDYHFVIEVDPNGMDGPYQPKSRWGFRPVATFAELPDNPVANGLCPGCFAYDIEYHMTIIATKAETEQARINE